MFRGKLTIRLFTSIRYISCIMVAAILLSLVLTLHPPQAKAADTQEIELTDGSVVTGEVVSLSGGIYTIRSAALGTLRIEASRVRVIRQKGSRAAGGDSGQINALKDRMLSDSEIMDSIRDLQNDPDFQKLMEDPEVIRAVQAGDIAALMKNPDFVKLLDKQAVQDINRKLAR